MSLDAGAAALVPYFIGLGTGVAGTFFTVRPRPSKPRPFDWYKSCPELRPDGEHHHVHVISSMARW